ncbi:MAG: hypothetical protein KKE65_06960 [Actinobacteria bacterium]|jgi:hypothetical protein|nr:hypothetical protein [Actinomycetota bacterium]MBU2111382.1 hypothetical protein [Actinomycetota bacterium]
MGISDPEVNDALSRRWRLQLGVAAGIMLVSAVVGLLLAIAYGESPVVPIFLLLGGLAALCAMGAVPLGVTPGDRPAMKASALWIVLAVLLFFGAPLLLGQLGWA